MDCQVQYWCKQCNTMQGLHDTSTHNKPEKRIWSYRDIPLQDIPTNTKDLNMFLSHRIALAKTNQQVTIAYITCNVLRGPYDNSKEQHGRRRPLYFTSSVQCSRHDTLKFSRWTIQTKTTLSTAHLSDRQDVLDQSKHLSIPAPVPTMQAMHADTTPRRTPRNADIVKVMTNHLSSPTTNMSPQLLYTPGKLILLPSGNELPPLTCAFSDLLRPC